MNTKAIKTKAATRAGNKSAKRARVANAKFAPDAKVQGQVVDVLHTAMQSVSGTLVDAYFAACLIMAKAYSKTPKTWFRRMATAIRAELVGNVQLQKDCESLGLSKASWGTTCTRMARVTVAMIANGPDHYKTFRGAYLAGQKLIDGDGKKDPRANNAAKGKTAGDLVRETAEVVRAARQGGKAPAASDGPPRGLHNAVIKLADVYREKVIPVLETEPDTLEDVAVAQAFAVEALAALQAESAQVLKLVAVYDKLLGDSTSELFRVER